MRTYIEGDRVQHELSSTPLLVVRAEEDWHGDQVLTVRDMSSGRQTYKVSSRQVLPGWENHRKEKRHEDIRQ